MTVRLFYPMKKIPVNVISGFLGSGKTTAIIQLINQKTDDEQWAVVSKWDLVVEATEQERLTAKFQMLFPNKQNFLTGGTNLLASLLNPDFGDRQEINKNRMESFQLRNNRFFK